MKTEDIKSFMKAWKDPAKRKDPGVTLNEFSVGRHWPFGNNKPGLLGTDYQIQVTTCLGLILYAPITSCIGSEWIVVPLPPLLSGKE